MSKKVIAAALALAVAAWSSDSLAAEGGSGVYALGFMGPQAGMVPPPGTYFTDLVYSYSGSASKSVSNQKLSVPGTGLTTPATASGRVEVEAEVLSNIAMLSHITDRSVLGGRLGFAVAVPYASVDLSAAGNGVLSLSSPEDSAALNLPLSGRAGRSLTGLGDVVVTGLLGWQDENLHYAAILNGYLPTGRYDVNRAVNVGRNHTAIEPMGSFTYLNPENGRELSAAAGLTINQENQATDYKTGLEFHLEASAIQHFSKFFYAGAGGYLYQQVTGDSGAGATGDFKGQVFAAGPLLGGMIPLSEQRVLLLNARYYEEWGAENRLEGRTIFVNATLSF